jgi:membrane protease YdiL (CAAX protease family)
VAGDVRTVIGRVRSGPPVRLHRAVALVARRPLTAFLAWFFTVGQLLAFMPAITGAVWERTLPTEPFIIASTFVGLLLPSVVITAAMEGREGLRRLQAAAFRYRIPARWYALAVIGVPAMTLAVQVVAVGPPGDGSAGVLVSAVGVGLIVQLVVVLLTVNLWEEVAWTGFVQARLQRRHRASTAALVASPFFTLQHLALVVGGSPAESAAVMALLLVLVVPFRALAAWVSNATHSLLLVGLVHAAGNAAAVGSVLGDGGLVPRVYDGQPGQSALAFALLGVVALAVTGGRLGRHERAPRPRQAPAEPAGVARSGRA